MLDDDKTHYKVKIFRVMYLICNIYFINQPHGVSHFEYFKINSFFNVSNMI